MSTSLSASSPHAHYEVDEPARDSRAFRNVLGRYGTGVAVVTMMIDGAPSGMTVNSFAAVSLEPPMILWSVRSDSGRAAAYVSADNFAVNVLSAEQVEISGSFASAKSGPEGFSRIGWSRGAGDAPLIDGAIARLECRRSAVYPGGDHHIIVGEVVRCSGVDGEPLLFVQGGYVTPQELSRSPEGGSGTAEASGAAGPQATFAQLLTAAGHRLSRKFDEYRSRFGLSVAGGRVLQRLSAGPRTADELAVSAYLGRWAVEDTLVRLAEVGWVVGSDGMYELTADGRDTYEEIAEIARQFNRDSLAGLGESDVAATRRVLEALTRL